MYKMMPQNMEAERSILSTILVNPLTIGDVVSYISPDDFYDTRNKVLYEAMLKMYTDGCNIDAVTVADAVKHEFRDGKVISYLTELFNSFVPVSMKSYCGILKENSNRPHLGDLRESGAIEQDADIVILLYRDDYYNPDSKEKGVVECIIAKNRNGPVGVRKLGWSGEFQKFIQLKKAGRTGDGSLSQN